MIHDKVGTFDRLDLDSAGCSVGLPHHHVPHAPHLPVHLHLHRVIYHTMHTNKLKEVRKCLDTLCILNLSLLKETYEP